MNTVIINGIVQTDAVVQISGAQVSAGSTPAPVPIPTPSPVPAPSPAPASGPLYGTFGPGQNPPQQFTCMAVGAQRFRLEPGWRTGGKFTISETTEVNPVPTYRFWVEQNGYKVGSPRDVQYTGGAIDFSPPGGPVYAVKVDPLLDVIFVVQTISGGGSGVKYNARINVT